MSTETMLDDAAEMPAILDAARAHAVTFWESLPTRPVVAPPFPASPLHALPTAGPGARRALAQFVDRFDVHLSGSAGPRYFGRVTGGSTPAALAADWLVSTYDQNAQKNGDTCAPTIEREAIAMLVDLLGLEPAMHGLFVTGATLSNAVGLAIGRQALGLARGIDVAEHGVAALGPVRVLSGCIHSSAKKAMSFVGLGRAAHVPVPLVPGREAIDVDALRALLLADRDTPTLVIANAGTVNTVDFDDVAAMAALRAERPFWLHVDGAFGAFAACSPRHAHLTDGLALADSVTVDAHKWLNVPYDAAMIFTRRVDLLRDVFQNLSPYLPPPSADPESYLHLAPENSRRLRALPAWMTLTAYGREGQRAMVERCVDLAARLGQLLKESERFVLADDPVRLNVVCFVPRTGGRDATAEDIRTFLQRLDADGRVCCTASELFGRPMVRAAFSSWQTRLADVEIAFAALDETARAVFD